MNNTQETPIVALCWATRKRRIAVDGHVLCQPKHKTSGYSVGNGQYNSLSLNGIPEDDRVHADVNHARGGGSHTDGVIPFLPLNKQPHEVVERSICVKCKRKYEKLVNSIK